MVHFKIDSENVFCLKMSHLAKSYKKKVVFTNFRNFKIFFRQIKISCCLQNISKFHIGQINHAWLRAFWKKKFQKFQKSGKKNFPHKIPQGPPQAGPLCLGVFPSCHNTFHQIWSNSSFLPFPPLLYRLSEFTLKKTKKNFFLKNNPPLVLLILRCSFTWYPWFGLKMFLSTTKLGQKWVNNSTNGQK